MVQEDEGVPSEDGDAEENASTSENAKQASTTDNNTATKAKRKKSKAKKKGKPVGSAAAAAADGLISKDDECVDDLIEKLAISHGDSESVSEAPSQSGNQMYKWWCGFYCALNPRAIMWFMWPV